GRGGFRIVFNNSGVANLTTFHCIYPKNTDPLFCAALTACLNSPVIQGLAKEHLRVYGGGLLKMEPGDLLDIQVPNLNKIPASTLQELADLLSAVDAAHRKNGDVTRAYAELDRAVNKAAGQAEN